MNQRILLIFAAFLCITAISSCCTPKHKSAYMRQTYKRIRHSVKSAEVTKLDDTIKVLFPSNLMFPFNSISIDSMVLPSMKRFSKVLNKYNRTAIMISGYTDSIGTDQYNNTLSSQRADTAKGTLIRYDINAKRINTWGMGKRHPISDNRTEEGRARNRRVEFVILYEEPKNK